MELKVLNIKGKETGRKVKLSPEVFGIEPNDHAIYLDVKSHLANKRQGTHKTKERAEIKGSTRKIKKQKGTGTARAGSIKNPLFRGGGRVFGPQPRDYSFKLNKKVKSLARCSALSYKASSKSIVIIEDFTFKAPKTKEYINLLTNLGLGEEKTMLIVTEKNSSVILSARNLKKASVNTINEINVYNILDASKLIITESVLKSMKN
tara:strand:- start:189 stop:806 length:618 start_codon:yes stop_codon:yes gene_type:complete